MDSEAAWGSPAGGTGAGVGVDSLGVLADPLLATMSMVMVVTVVVVATVSFLACIWPVRVQALDELRRAGLVMGNEVLPSALEVDVEWKAFNKDVVRHGWV